MTTFLDAELRTYATHILGPRSRPAFPLAMSYERSELGAYFWHVWIENGGYAVEAKADELSTALREALIAFNKAKAQRDR